MLFLCAGEPFSVPAARHLAEAFAATSMLLEGQEQLRVLLRTGPMEDAAAANDEVGVRVENVRRLETNMLYRLVCRWWRTEI